MSRKLFARLLRNPDALVFILTTTLCTLFIVFVPSPMLSL